MDALVAPSINFEFQETSHESYVPSNNIIHLGNGPNHPFPKSISDSLDESCKANFLSS